MKRSRRLLWRGGRRRQLLALDTMVFIYTFEANRQFVAETRAVLTLIERGEIRGSTSALTLTEVLTGPYRQGDRELGQRYRQIFGGFPNLSVTAVGAEVADRAAALRARYGLRTPDALHLACAIHSSADAFVTADRRLAAIDDLEVLVLEPTVQG